MQKDPLKNIGLAPMEGVTTLPTRMWFWLASAPLTMSTPFLRVTETYPHDALPLGFAPELDPVTKKYFPYQLIPQLMSVESAHFIEAVKFFDSGIDFFELNCGCPSPTCVGKGAGSSILQDPKRFRTMVSDIAQQIGPKKLAVKMRTGYEDKFEFPNLIDMLKDIDLARVTVHGRTRVDRYSGKANWELIEYAAQNLKVPVIASGDICSNGCVDERIAADSQISGFVVGRGALRNPWIFEELRFGRKTTIAPQAFLEAMKCYALLQEIFLRDLSEQKYGDFTTTRTMTLLDKGLLQTTPGTDLEQWIGTRQLFESALESSERAFAEVKFSSITLGRTKMLWNYLRSSVALEGLFLDPRLLRSKSLFDFSNVLHGVLDESDSHINIAYNPDHDWIYSGAKKVLPHPLAPSFAATTSVPAL